MRLMGVAVSTALVAAGVAGGVGMAPPAQAGNPAINGTYTATVIGDWARSRQVYHQEPVVRSTWKISTSCANPYECTGQVVSDQGWSAPVTMTDGLNWYLKREIPNWETCANGASYTATDYFSFYPANPETGENTPGSPVLAGRDHTIGPSGACGSNLPLDIDQPFRLDKIG
jgi:hypothetical protein